MAPSIWEQYGVQLLNPYINGMDQVRYLAERGRTEEARDLLISCTRAAWQYRWRTKRVYTLRRLGESLDTQRYPSLVNIAEDLATERPGSAAGFLDYLRRRAEPDASSFVQKPTNPGKDFNPDGQYSCALWNAWVTTKDMKAKEAMDRRIAMYLDPHSVITWHESAGNWASLVMSALHHGGIEDDTLCHLILFGLDHAEECNVTSHLAEPAQPSIGGNHLFSWIDAWLKFTILFPEFRRTPALQFSAIARLDDEISKQVAPDGSMIEGCPGYHNCCLAGAGWCLSLAQRHGLVLTDRLRQAWERMLWFAIGIQQPDFRTPYFGDSQDNYTPWFVGQVKPYYPLPEAEWTASEGKVGSPPSFTSRAFPSIGYYVQRSAWSADALYLCFDGGRFGQSHFHEDKLHFVMSAYGRRFLVDVGNHSYSDHWLAQWSVLSQAHNTVLIDGAGQCRWREDRDKWYSHVPLKNPWMTGPVWDVVEAEFDGPYERDIGDVKVRRRVVFHKGEPPFFWITDWIEGSGTHEATELFHFAHDIDVIEEVPGGVRTRIPGGPDLGLLVMTADGVAPHNELSVKRHRGERNPPRGWVAPELYREEQAWEVHFASAGATPMRRDFLLLPWRTSLPDVNAILSHGGNSPCITLSIGGRTTRIDLPSSIRV